MSARRCWLRILILELGALLVTGSGDNAIAFPQALSTDQTYVAGTGASARYSAVQGSPLIRADLAPGGTSNPEVEQFSYPNGVFVDGGGRIYVADSGNNRIVRVNDMAATGWTTLGTKGKGINQFEWPLGIFVDRAGRIYVTDMGNDRIVRLNDMTGAGWTTFGTRGSGVNQFHAPQGIFVDGGGHIYVADSGNNRVVRVNDMTGSGWTTLGIPGNGVRQFQLPRGILVNKDGRIYVADSSNHRIVRMNDMMGAGWTTFGTLGTGVNQFLGPDGLFVDGASHIFVTCVNGRIVRLDDMAGTGWTTFGQGYNQFYIPSGIFVDQVGRIYAADLGYNRIARMDDMTGAAWVVMPALAQSTAPRGTVQGSQQESVTSCGGYVVRMSGEHPTRVRILKADSVVETVENDEIQIFCRSNLIGRTPAIVLVAWSGGASCCFTVRVYRTDPFGRVLYSEAYAVGPQILDPVGGRQYSALLFEESQYGRFFDDLHPVTMPYTPLVACFSGDRFQDCTQRYPSVVEKCETTYAEALTRVLQHKWPWGDTGPVVANLWGADAEVLRGVSLGKEMCGLIHGTDHLADITQEIGARTHDANLAKFIGTWLQKHRENLIDWVRSRGQELLRRCPPSAQGTPC